MSSMKKAREYNKIIVARVNEELKAKFDSYCEHNGIGGSEAIRCYIMNLPEVPDKLREAKRSRLRPRAEAAGVSEETEAGT